jgi:hypothetical protein
MAKWLFTKDCIIATSGINVEYSYRYSSERVFTITASKHGVSFNDSPVFTENVQLQAFARALGDATKDFASLRRTGKPYDPTKPYPGASSGSQSDDAAVATPDSGAPEDGAHAGGDHGGDTGVPSEAGDQPEGSGPKSA